MSKNLRDEKEKRQGYAYLIVMKRLEENLNHKASGSSPKRGIYIHYA